MLTRLICSALLVTGALAFSAPGTAIAAEDDGIVKFKSAYPMPETIERMKKDIADKGIKFFDEIDQSKLAADAAITASRTGTRNSRWPRRSSPPSPRRSRRSSA